MIIHKKSHSAFTLVELIVVIVILAILATIAFLSFSNQSSSARDSTRLSDVSNIVKGLMVFSTVGGTYPVPDKAINIMSGTTQIGYQGEAGDKVLKMINFSAGGGKDPLDKVYYTYNTNLVKNKAQLLAFLENNSNVAFDLNPFGNLNQTFATDYANRYAFEKGDQLGIILNKTIATTGTNSGSVVYTPIQDFLTVGSGFDTKLTSTGKVVVVDNSSLNTPGVNSVIFAGYTSGTGLTIINGLEPHDPIVSGAQIKLDTNLYSLSDNEIKYIFAAGSEFTTNWNSNACNTGSININTGTFLGGIADIGITNLVANTIYKVPNGTYNLTGSMRADGHIKFNGNCIALIGESMDGVSFKSALTGGTDSNNGTIQLSGRSNNIISNLKLDGNKGATYKYYYGIMIKFSSFNNTLNNIDSYNNIYYGVQFVSTVSYATISNSLLHDNGLMGLSIAGAVNNFANNIETYNNTGYGIGLQSSANNTIINNSQNYNNGQLGLMIGDSSNNMIVNSQNYNNGNYGVYFLGTALNNALNNVQNYNNGNYGVYLSSDANTLNNVQNYNNGIHGIQLNSSTNTFNNLQNYNNNGYGVKVNVGATGNKFYGTLKIFGNASGDSNGTNLNDSVLMGSTSSSLGWANGTINTGVTTMDCTYHSQPDLFASWGACAGRGQIVATTIPVTSYIYGSNVLNQTQPVYCPAGQSCPNGTNLQLFGTSGVHWNPSKKIGQW